jgi:hypothetical protein
MKNDKQLRTTAKQSQPAADDGLPLEDYDSLSANQILNKLTQLSPKQIEKLCRYEMANQGRRNLLRRFQDSIGAVAATSDTGREDPPPAEERPHKRRQVMSQPFAREDPPPGEERPERRTP